MKRLLEVITVWAIFIGLVWSLGPHRNPTVLAAPAAALDVSDMDLSAKPGDNWYAYANGNWQKKNPIPDEYSRWGAFEKLRDENLASLRELLEEASKNAAPQGSVAQKIGDFFRSGMDTAAVEKAGLNPLQPEFDRIERIQSIEDLQKSLSRLHSFGTNVFFNLVANSDEKDSTIVIANLYQGGLGLPDRDYYTGQDARSKEMRQEYLKHLGKMFELQGLPVPESQKYAALILKLETRMAEPSSTRLELRDPQKNYNKKSLAELEKLAPAIDWNGYFASLKIQNPGYVNVGQPRFFQTVSAMFKEVPLADWKVYLHWHLLHEAAPYLPAAFEQENFNFYGRFLTGAKVMQPRWKRCIRTTSEAMGEALGQLYVEKYFPPEAKARMLALVDHLKKGLRQRITNLEWMGEATKKEALVKLDAINVKIGYPDKWRDYAALEITPDSYAINVFRASQFEVKRGFEKIGKAPDRTEWDMSPQTVNAYYNPNLNEIVFPAAILQPPFFNLRADDAVNYGAIGVVIGHEMTHGFDDQGRQYDAKGNLRDWWTASDAAEFEKRAQVLVKQYNAFSPLPGSHVDGKLTLGENIADVGGVTVSFLAYQYSLEGKPKPAPIDGFSGEQRFFLAFAHLWAENIRDQELQRRLKEDVHSPARYRATGPLFNVAPFYAAFGIKPGDKLFQPESDRVRIW